MTDTSASPLNNQKVNAALNALLGSFGVADLDSQTQLESAVEAVLADAGLTARVDGLRYGRLTLIAGAHQAHLLNFASAQILDALQQRVPGLVTSLNVRVAVASRRSR